MFVVVTTTSTAHAQDLVESDPAVIRARAAVQEAQAAAHGAADEVTQVTQQRDATQASIDDHVVRVAELDRQRADLAAQRAELRADLRTRAASLYMSGGDTSDLDSLMADSALDVARQQELGDVAARTTLRSARKLQEAREGLAKVQDTLRREEGDLRAQKADLDDLVAQQEKLQAEMDRKVAAANTALAQARAIGAMRVQGEPIMGPSLLTADQLVAWYRAQGYHPRLEVDISELAQIFIEEGNDENVRGDFAFAQSIVETAGFNAAPDNNYSGIGWCDSCSTGNKFPNPREGVRAQIQLLLNYADSGVPRRQPPPPGEPVSLRPRRRRGGTEVRHLLREGLGSDVARHGQRELGHRAALRGSGDRRLPEDADLRAGRLTGPPGRASRRVRPPAARRRRDPAAVTGAVAPPAHRPRRTPAPTRRADAVPGSGRASTRTTRRGAPPTTRP